MKPRSMKRLAIAGALVLTSPFVACVIPDVDYTGRPCSNGSCPAGFVCATGKCERGSDGGASPGAERCSAALGVSGLRASWQTPNTIRWEWTVTGDTTQFNGYELVVTSDPAGAAGAKTWTHAEAPELGYYKLPTTLHEDYVHNTITHGLDESTLYHARLVVKDKQGATCSTEVASARTQVGRGLRAIPIFTNGFADGTRPDPTSFVVVTGPGGYGDSSAHLEVHWALSHPAWVASCGAAPEKCFINAHVYGVDRETQGITQVALEDSAFFEYALSYFPEAGVTIDPAWWTSAGLCFGPQGAVCFVFEPMTLRVESPGAYRVVQIPLRAFKNAQGASVSLAEVHTGVDNFFVGGDWSSASVLRVDQVSIRY